MQAQCYTVGETTKNIRRQRNWSEASDQCHHIQAQEIVRFCGENAWGQFHGTEHQLNEENCTHAVGNAVRWPGQKTKTMTNFDGSPQNSNQASEIQQRPYTTDIKSWICLGDLTYSKIDWWNWIAFAEACTKRWWAVCLFEVDNWHMLRSRFNKISRKSSTMASTYEHVPRKNMSVTNIMNK